MLIFLKCSSFWYFMHNLVILAVLFILIKGPVESSYKVFLILHSHPTTNQIPVHLV